MATVTNTKLEENKYEMLISIDAETLAKAVEDVINEVRNNVNIKGFRKGKAPRNMIEKMYGEETFLQEAVRDLAPDEIKKAVEGEGLELIESPQMDVVSVSKENGAEIKITAQTKPEVRLSGYKGIEITKVVKAVTEEDIDEHIQKLLERNSRLVTVEGRAAEDGDTVVIDFDGYSDGKQFEGGKAENYDLTLGSGQFIPGFEEQIVGKNVGDEFSVFVDFPEDYHSEELAGKPAEFKIVLHEIQAPEKPELDDEFVKDTSDFDTLEEYKTDIRKTMEEDNEEEAQKVAEDDLFKELANRVDAIIPELLFERKIDEMVEDTTLRVRRQGFTMDTYMRFAGLTMEKIREDYRELAETQVKVRLALEKIVKLEAIEIPQEDVEAEEQKIADYYGYTLKKVKTMIDEDMVRLDLAVAKASDFVKENAKYN